MLKGTLIAIAVGLAGLLLAAPAQAGRMPAPPHVWAHHQLNPICGGSACASRDTDEIWLPPNASRFAISHEIGHIFWQQVATDADRAWMQHQLGFAADIPWYNGTGWPAGLHSPDERAADAYAACDLNLSRTHWIDTYGYQPSTRRHRRICTGIAMIGYIRLRVVPD